MRALPINDLPKYSPWPERLLWKGEVRERTPYKVLREYDFGKYGNLMAAIEGVENIGPHELRAMEIPDLQRTIPFSHGRKLSIGIAKEVWALYERWLLPVVATAAEGCRSIVDLGCGWGYLLSQLRWGLGPGFEYHGCDFARNAVLLADRVHKGAVKVVKGDLNDPAWPVVENARPPICVMTSYALHQLDPEPVLMTLKKHAANRPIRRIVICEPDETTFENDLLGLLRKRYQEVNGYSGSAHALMADMAKLVSEKSQAFGVNPLLPARCTVWKFDA